MTSEQEKKILKEGQERLKKAKDEDGENRKWALEDLEFINVPGAQWPEEVKAQRANRPCLETNKAPTYIDQVVGDQRMNRPSIKVLPVDSYADVEMARIWTGWIRHVQQISSADIAIDHGFEHAVACGYGAMRVVTRYISDKSFEQEAFIEKIENALAVYWGPHTKYDCSDAEYCFIVTEISREEYQQKYNKTPMAFNTTDSNYIEGWCSQDKVVVAEYFAKVVEKKKIYLLKDNRVVYEPKENDEVIQSREADSTKIMWYLLSGDAVLKEQEWAGKKYIPIIPIWGKEFNVGGKRYLRGLVRFAKDAIRMYNYFSSTNTEVIALQPRAPFLATPTQIGEFDKQWKNAPNQNFPYLLYNPDPKAPGPPKREAPPQASSAIVQGMAQSDQDIRDTMGLQKAALGMQSNERSGAAIRERKKEGDTGTFAFMDNLSRSMEHLGRVLIDTGQGILDTNRLIRLGLVDGSQEFVEINKTQEDGSILNDPTIGIFDVTVVVGPSFTTQRTEAAASMQQFIQYYPAAAPLIGDLIAKNSDWPGAEEISERLKFLLPPEIRAVEELKKTKAGAGLPPSPAPAPPVQQQAAQPPDPTIALKVKQEEIKLKEAEVKLQQEQAKLRQIEVQTQGLVAQNKLRIKELVDEVVREEGSRQGDEDNARSQQSTTGSNGNGSVQPGQDQ